MHKTITIQIPGSKSITNRALLLSALAEGTSIIHNPLISDDTMSMIHALKKLGVHLFEADSHIQITGCNGIFPKKNVTINCQEAGTTARFLLAATANINGNFLFDADPQLCKRPMGHLLTALKSLGALVNPEGVNQLPLEIIGRDQLLGGELSINAKQSGQFVSALLMIAPYFKHSLTLHVSETVSQPFIDMTCKLMHQFGSSVKQSDKTYKVSLGNYNACELFIEPDASTASYFLAAAAITNKTIQITNVNLKTSLQGDWKFVSILEKMGCEFIQLDQSIKITRTKPLCGVEVDMQDCSDTFLTLAAIAPFANSPTLIKNIGHTRLQESDRIAAIEEALLKLNVIVESGRDWIKIYPSKPIGTVVNSYDDHRIAMALTVTSLRTKNITIENPDCVNKTCPEFFDLWKQVLS